MDFWLVKKKFLICPSQLKRNKIEGFTLLNEILIPIRCPNKKKSSTLKYAAQRDSGFPKHKVK